VTGSFLIGLALTLIHDQGPPYLRPLLVSGVLGGYTTFSAFEWETLVASRMARSPERSIARIRATP